MTDRLLLSSKEIIEKAIKDYQPYAIGLMLSGGNDSLTALEVCKQLGVKLDFIMHGITGTGIQETHDFVKQVVSREKCKYIEANAGDAYERYVLRKGFIGVGVSAHEFSYHILKADPFRAAISKHIRQGKKNRFVLLINGGRRLESENRRKTFILPVKVDKRVNVWVNIINEWPDHSTTDFLDGNSIQRNPVSKLLCKSGECNCGTVLCPGDRVEIGYHFPKWLNWIDSLRAAVKAKGFTWDWAESMPKGIALEKRGQLNMFQPMCSSCVVSYEKSLKEGKD